MEKDLMENELAEELETAEEAAEEAVLSVSLSEDIFAPAVPAEPVKKSFSWAGGLRVVSWIVFAMVLAFFLFNAYQYLGAGALYPLIYTGYGLFYGLILLFGLHAVADMAENSKKSADALEELLELKKKEL